MRRHEAAYSELGLQRPDLSRAQLIAAMVAHPQLIERPIVIHAGQARIGHPPETVLELFENL